MGDKSTHTYNTTKAVVATYLHFKPCTWSLIMTLDRLSICWGRQATTLSPYCRWIWRFLWFVYLRYACGGLGMHRLRISHTSDFFLVKLDLLLRCVCRLDLSEWSLFLKKKKWMEFYTFTAPRFWREWRR